MQFRDFSEIEIIREQFAFKNARQFDQLGIDFLLLGKIHFVNSYFTPGVLANATESLESSAASRTAGGIAGVCDKLQFVQHELRDHDDSFYKSVVDQIGDSAVDDHAGVEHDHVFWFVLGSESDVGNQQGKILFVASNGENHSEITETQKKPQPDEPDRFPIRVDKEVGAIYQPGHHRTKKQAECRTGERPE